MLSLPLHWARAPNACMHWAHACMHWAHAPNEDFCMHRSVKSRCTMHLCRGCAICGAHLRSVACPQAACGERMWGTYRINRVRRIVLQCVGHGGGYTPTGRWEARAWVCGERMRGTPIRSVACPALRLDRRKQAN